MKPSKMVIDRLITKLFYAGDCWVFTGYRNPKGYGRMMADGKVQSAHRLAYAAWKGEIGDLHVLHSCDNPPCCNPSHLFLGTCADNMADKKMKGRQAKGGDRNSDKLTPNRVREIIDSTLSDFELACQFGVARSTVSAVREGRSWVFVTGLKPNAGLSKKYSRGPKTHCPVGHELTESNRYLNQPKRPWRCRACHNAKRRLQREKSRGL